MRKISLKEYVQLYGQEKVAEQLGVRQSAISKAIRYGRNITILIDENGVIGAEELRNFPSQKRNGSIEHAI